MSLITPIPQSTSIKLYKGVIWDSTYNNVRWFTSQSDRTAYLADRLIGQWSKCSVVSPGKSIKVEVPQSFNSACVGNYLTFVNGEMGDPAIEWCAFVTSVDYVNVNTIQINYTIDWIQSFMFYFVFEQCFVEREHVNDDSFGKHVVDEGISISDYSIEDMQLKHYQKGWVVYYLSQIADNVEVQSKNGVLMATYMIANRYNVFGDLELFLNQLNQNGESDKVVSLTMCPMPIGDQPDITNPNLKMTFGLQNSPKTFTDGSETYTAQNNKMGIYPYKLFTMDNFDGSVQEFKWENFSGNPAFVMDGVIHPRPCLECYPTNYLKYKGSVIPTRNFAIQYTNFPQIPWTSDTFRAWVSQNGTGMFWDNVSKGVSVAGGALSTALGIASGNAGMGIAGAMTAMNAYAGLERNENAVNYHATHGTQLGGAIEGCGLDYLHNDIGFRLIQYCIKPSVAKRIDKFFTRFGYRVDEVKVPNITGRRYVNYVKCNVANVGGNIPNDAKTAMETALLNGVSFWHVNNMGFDVTTNPIV